MDIRELKKLLKTSTSVLIMENGNPDLVVMDYQAYLKLAKMHDAGDSVPKDHIPPVNDDIPEPNGVFDQTGREAEILERLNREILTLKQQIQAEEERLGGNPPQDLTF